MFIRLVESRTKLTPLETSLTTVNVWAQITVPQPPTFIRTVHLLLCWLALISSAYWLSSQSNEQNKESLIPLSNFMKYIFLITDYTR